MSTLQEEWRPVVGYEGLYSVSSHGRVWSERVRRVLRPGDNAGYKTVVLTREGNRRTLRVHRLVFAAFVGPLVLRQEINHLDGDKSNNCLENLEQTTHQRNMEHARDLRGGIWPRGAGFLAGEKNPDAKLTAADVRRIRTEAKRGAVQAELARAYGVSPLTISRIVRRLRWKHLPD